MHSRTKIFATCISMLFTGLFFSVNALTHTVSKTGQSEFHSIQAAVDASGPNDSILILDSEKYEECVTVAFKRDLTMLSQPSLSKKPSISFQDKIRISPKNCDEANDSATVNFMKNGALRILQSSNITIAGLTIDGISPYPFGFVNIWGCRFPMQSGNVAASVYYSSNIIIENCEIINAYFGIYISAFVSVPSDGRIIRPPVASGNTIVFTGNHLITNNRIHHNTYGLCFENDQELGSVIKNNLFYNNCHANDSTAQKVNSMTSEGSSQPSGALLFKNLQKTPLAIYNNTFFNNYLIFTAHWRSGNHYLIFNNIYGQPNHYWSKDAVFPNSFMASDQIFINRMFNCLYSCQSDPVRYFDEIIYRYDKNTDTRIPIDTIRNCSPRIMNGLGDIESGKVHLSIGDFDTTLTSIKSPGNLILGNSTTKPFPASANIRWLEPVFKSTDPSTPEFLIPDWNDTYIKSFIIDKGWEASGIRDGDGSIADIGAISVHPNTVGRVRIIAAATLTDKSLDVIPFYLSSDKKLTDCKIEYCKFVNNCTYDTNSFGYNNKVLPSESIYDVTVSGTVVTGLNILPCKISGTVPSVQYGHFELIVSGSNEQGIRVSSTPGFIPVCIGTTQPQLDVTFNVIDTTVGETKTEDQIEFRLKAKPGTSKTVYRRLSLQKLDGTRVLNIHGKEVYLDSLSIPQEGTVYATIFTDTFAVEHNVSVPVQPFLFKTSTTSDTNVFAYSTHMVKLTTPTSTRNRVLAAIVNNTATYPEFAAIYNLTGKKVAVISYVNYLNKCLPSGISRGMYVVKFLQANRMEIKKAGITKVVIR